MDKFVADFISTYGVTIVGSILTAIFGYIGIALKNIYTKYVNDDIKKKVVATCVKAVEQIYKDIHGNDKLNKCLDSVIVMLGEQGIKITSTEAKMLVECAVKEMNEKSGIILDVPEPAQTVEE